VKIHVDVINDTTLDLTVDHEEHPVSGPADLRPFGEHATLLIDAAPDSHEGARWSSAIGLFVLRGGSVRWKTAHT
jgi:hypothetical protein